MEYKKVSCNDFLYSAEAIEKNNDNSVTNSSSFKASQKAQKPGIKDKVKNLPKQVDTIIERAKLLGQDVKQSLFYKRYLDRVNGGLYNRYASEAHVFENEMIDDPVTILKGPCKDYIHDITEDINKLYNTLLDMSKELETKTNAEQCISVIKKYCSEYIGETKSGHNKENTTWDKRLLDSTKYKIARILTRYGERKIYGYTDKNMVLKGFPKPNHIIVTLFEENPQEEPIDQNVSDVFKSAESFDIIAYKDKDKYFNITNMSNAALNKTVNGKVINDIKQFRANALNNFKKSDTPNKADEGKILDQIWTGMNLSAKELLSKKGYIIDCINTYFDMIVRINRLAIVSIKSMLAVENNHRDKDYDRSLNVKHYKYNAATDEDNKQIDEAYDKLVERNKTMADVNKTARKMNKDNNAW